VIAKVASQDLPLDAALIAAGLAGSTYGDWLFVHDLWVRADPRRRGIGQELLRLAEARARERGCHSAWLDTFSFQAPEFYPKFGYREFGGLIIRPTSSEFSSRSG
jgi:GNAT superfamily N-acetyltransferase